MALPRKLLFPLDKRAIEEAFKKNDWEEMHRALRAIVTSLDSMYSDLYRHIEYLEAEVTWNPGSIADGDEEAQEVTCEGAALGDFALASFSLDVADLVLDAQVTTADTVTCVLANNTGGAVDLNEGTLKVRVFK